MHVDIVTLFPEVFGSPLAVGPLRRARELGRLTIALHQLRDYATGRHLQVDDVPYGGGQGMLMKPEPLVTAIEHVAGGGGQGGGVAGCRRILLSARGRLLDQARVEALAREPRLLLVCGRYEGVDERVTGWIDEELAIGDYVLSGGEPAALVLLDALARLLPDVLGNAASAPDDSFATGLLEYPQYTRPWEFRGVRVPDVLGSGDHAAIRRWRREESLRVTLARRPELLERATLDATDRAFLRGLGWGGRGSRDG